jgi:hypothetical protein
MPHGYAPSDERTEGGGLTATGFEPERQPDLPADEWAEEAPAFRLEKRHERRILSWSPDPEEELEDEVAEAEEEPQLPPQAVGETREQPSAAPERSAEPAFRPAPVTEPRRPEPPRLAQQAVRAVPTPARPAVRPPEPAMAPAPEPVRPMPAAPPVAAYQPNADAPKKRGRPRGRPRRQVHFHVDPDEELLLLAAARKHGSQQKGLIAALQALQDNEVLRDEVERLRAECERQRVLLADAEAIFKR